MLVTGFFINDYVLQNYCLSCQIRRRIHMPFVLGFLFHLYCNPHAFTQYLNLTESSILSVKTRKPPDIFTCLLRYKTKLGRLISLFPSH